MLLVKNERIFILYNNQMQLSSIFNCYLKLVELSFNYLYINFGVIRLLGET